MQYLGGKSRLAKDIANVIAPEGLWWDPFCGGLSVSVQLSKYGPGLVSDANPALISLYSAIESGWTPPLEISYEDWISYKSLPDSDPIKALAGIGCSYQGMWFHSYYGPKIYPPSVRHPTGKKRNNPVWTATKALNRDVPILVSAGCTICHIDFFDIEPTDVFSAIYCDPPYAGAQGYEYFSDFDSVKFWQRCVEWAKYTLVYVSERRCPVDSSVVWEKSHEIRLGNKGQTNGATIERLFLVHPS